MEALQELVLQNSLHQFIFFCEMPLAIQAKNYAAVRVSRGLQHKLFLKFWYNYRLPKLLGHYNADAFISLAGALSAKITIPQFLLFEADVLQDYTGCKKRFQKTFITNLQQAKNIFVSEMYFKNETARAFPHFADKIKVVYHPTAGNATSLTSLEQDAVKQKYSNGYDFFYCPVTAGSLQYILLLLKAFSIFKKWQKSSLKMILHGPPAAEQLVENFANYKYKNDIFFVQAADEAIVSAAYCVVCLDNYSPAGYPFVVLKTAVPLILFHTALNDAVFSGAVFFAGKNAQSLAGQMADVYKDEDKRAQVVQAGKLLAQKYNAGNTATLLWHELVKK